MYALEAPDAGRQRTRRPAQEPLSRYSLVRTTDVSFAEEAGAKLLSENHLQPARTDDFEARIHGVSLGPISFYYLNYGAELDVITPPLGDYIALILPLTGSMDVTLGPQRFRARAGTSAGVISCDAPLRMHWHDEFSMLCARIDVLALAEFVRHLDPGITERPIVFSHVITRPAALESVWGAARVITDVFERTDPNDRPPPLISAQLREQFMTTLLLTQPNSYSRALLTPTASISHRAVGQAVELIDSAPDYPHTVSSIARTIGVSTRALQTAFRRHLDTSPGLYLTEARLRRARRELTMADPSDGTTVADVAMRWGFSNPGRFAGYYRRRFGESPSTTLGAGPGHA
jgi:AraC-like DNA-binding protein